MTANVLDGIEWFYLPENRKLISGYTPGPCVYILKFPPVVGIVKIGQTTRLQERISIIAYERMLPATLVAFGVVQDHKEAEVALHAKFKMHHLPDNFLRKYKPGGHYLGHEYFAEEPVLRYLASRSPQKFNGPLREAFYAHVVPKEERKNPTKSQIKRGEDIKKWRLNRESRITDS